MTLQPADQNTGTARPAPSGSSRLQVPPENLGVTDPGESLASAHTGAPLAASLQPHHLPDPLRAFDATPPRSRPTVKPPAARGVRTYSRRSRQYIWL